MSSDIEKRVYAIERPEPSLLKYYFLSSFVAGPLFFIPLIPFYFRYHTMRYAFDDEGITMRWGILFRREISLTYARIQDIHLTSNFVERWFGLARIQIQTASGSADAEMTIEGVHEFQLVRDFLYTRMRGVRGGAAGPSPSSVASADTGEVADLAAALGAVAQEMREIRALVARLVERSDRA